MWIIEAEKKDHALLLMKINSHHMTFLLSMSQVELLELATHLLQVREQIYVETRMGLTMKKWGRMKFLLARRSLQVWILLLAM